MVKTLGQRIRELRERDDLSLREFARKLGVSAAFLSDVELGRRHPSIIAIGDQGLTRRGIFEVFLWGGLAHANPEKKRIYDEWVTIPFLFPLAQNEFIYTLAQILRVIFFARDVNRAVIVKLGSAA